MGLWPASESLSFDTNPQILEPLCWNPFWLMGLKKVRVSVMELFLFQDALTWTMASFMCGSREVSRGRTTFCFFSGKEGMGPIDYPLAPASASTLRLRCQVVVGTRLLAMVI